MMYETHKNSIMGGFMILMKLHLKVPNNRFLPQLTNLLYHLKLIFIVTFLSFCLAGRQCDKIFYHSINFITISRFLQNYPEPLSL